MVNTFTLIIKIKLQTGETERHIFKNCPNTKEAFHIWWDKLMEDVFSSDKGLRKWIKLDNPTIFYNVEHIATWVFETDGDKELPDFLTEETEFMLRIV